MRQSPLFIAAIAALPLALSACSGARDQLSANLHDAKRSVADFTNQQGSYLTVGNYSFGTIADDTPSAHPVPQQAWNTRKQHKWGVRLDNGRLIHITQAGPRLYAGQRVTVVRQGLKLVIVP